MLEKDNFHDLVIWINSEGVQIRLEALAFQRLTTNGEVRQGIVTKQKCI